MTRFARSFAGSRLRLAFALVAGIVVVLLATSAFAQSKSIVVYVEGPDAASARAPVLQVVPKTLGVVDPDAFSKALAQAGQRGPMGNQIAIARGREKVLERVRKAIGAVGAEGAVIGRVRRTRSGGQEVWVLFVDPIPGDLAVDEAVPLEAGDRAAPFRAALGPSLDAVAPAETKKIEAPAKPEASAATSEGTDAAEEEPAAEGDRKPHDIGTALFVAGLAFEMGGRRFEYSDPLEGSTNLRPYDVFGAPLAVVHGELYPLAGTSAPIARDLGLTVSFAHAFGLSSSTSGGDPIGTNYNRFNAGLRLRIRTGDAGSPVLGVSGGFGLVSFTFDDPPPDIADSLPGVSYAVLRGGIDGRVPLGSVLALTAGFDYLGALSAGDVYNRFTGPSIGGIAARAGFAVTVTEGIEMRLGAEYTRFFYAFEPEVGDAYVAGGALDELLALSLGAAYVY